MDNNGTTQSNSRRCNDSLPQTKPVIMEQTSLNGLHDGIESFPVSGEDRFSGNINWKLTPIRDTTAGKILERLEIIESQYLNYVQSHQDRLKARLGESEQSKEEFLKESNQIKSDLYHLAVAQQNSNGNGHQ
jgi:hypothetical protein